MSLLKNNQSRLLYRGFHCDQSCQNYTVAFQVNWKLTLFSELKLLTVLLNFSLYYNPVKVKVQVLGS